MALCNSCGLFPKYRIQGVCKSCANARRRVRYKEQPEKFKGDVRKQRIKRKQQILETYGGKCICCNESNIGFLTIDHIDGGGNVHRRSIGNVNFYDWLKANNYPAGYQVMCMNCNWGRRVNQGICPHQQAA